MTDRKIKIYLDMDGVIADFFGALEKHYNVSHWKELPNMEQTLKDLKGTDFFGKIPKFQTSDKLIDYVNFLTQGDWNILSSPLRDDHKNSSFWKRYWLKKHSYKPIESIFTGRKEKYAISKGNYQNILVDDKPKNIQRWRDKGGIGLLYQANENSLESLFKDLRYHYIIDAEDLLEEQVIAENMNNVN
tara:strand:- start:224 stop:787 length:564 start_codon:yes stop_codon:yes gene_type:complete